MTCTAYFIGGPRDLSKQVLDTERPPRTLYYARVEPFRVWRDKGYYGPTLAVPPRDEYRQVGYELPVGDGVRGTYLYVWFRTVGEAA